MHTQISEGNVIERNFYILTETVLHNIISGDEKAFEELFVAYKERLYAFGLSTLGSHDEAIEIVQETFVRIWENREKIVPEKNFQAYLYQIARNLITDRIKKRSSFLKLSQAVAENVNPSEHSTDNTIAIRTIESLEYQVVSSMPPQRQKIYLLSRHENKSHKEIAALLGLDVSTVRVHIKLALKTMRDHFRIYGYLPTLFIFLLPFRL